MRLYYIFSIKDSIYKIIKNNPEKLYHLLESIYKLKHEDIRLGYKLFEKTCNFLDKKNLNNLIKNLNYDNMSYTSFRDSHLMNDFYKDESTKLTVNNSHVLIKTNVVYPNFFNEIKTLKNAFVCDFVNEDYFFLKSIMIKNKVRN